MHLQSVKNIFISDNLTLIFKKNMNPLNIGILILILI